LFTPSILLWGFSLGLFIYKGMFNCPFDWHGITHVYLPLFAAVVGLAVPIVCLRLLRHASWRVTRLSFAGYLATMLTWAAIDIRHEHYQMGGHDYPNGPLVDGHRYYWHAYYTWYFIPYRWIEHEIEDSPPKDGKRSAEGTWPGLECERAERPFHPVLNPPVEFFEIFHSACASLPFAFGPPSAARRIFSPRFPRAPGRRRARTQAGRLFSAPAFSGPAAFRTIQADDDVKGMRGGKPCAVKLDMALRYGTLGKTCRRPSRILPITAPAKISLRGAFLSTAPGGTTMGQSSLA